MDYQIVFHPKAESELEALYDDIAERASPAIAWNFVVGIREHCLDLSTFPQRGTERVEIMPGAADCWVPAHCQHCIRRRGRAGTDFGRPLRAGRNITRELLEERL